MSDHPNITYLKSDAIGKVLATGLAETYRLKPKFPIDFFAKWLLNFSKEQENKKKALEKVKQIQEIEDEYKSKEYNIERYKVKIQKKQENNKKYQQEFKEKIENSEYHDELIEKDLPQEIYYNIKATGTYVAVYDYPTVEIDLENEDSDVAHINMDSNKILSYIGGDEDTLKQMKGKQLPIDSGVTYNLFNPPNQEQDPNNEEGEVVEGVEEDHIYIPDVVINRDIHFFEIPKLGSYMAVPLFVKGYQNAISFDDAVAKTKDYNEKQEENKLYRQEKEEEYEEKIRIAKENEEDYQDIVEEFKAIEWPEEPEPEFENELKQYVLCCDTIGMDKELTEKEREYILDVCNHFVKCWEEAGLKYLKNDVQMYLEYEKNNEIEEILNAWNEAEEREIAAIANDLSDLPEDEAIYKQDEARLGIIKEQLTNEEDCKKNLLSLSESRFIKFHDVLKNGFYLVGFSKDEINLPGTNVLNWRRVRNNDFNEEFFEKVISYEYKGPKEEKSKSYSYINKIKDRLETINQDEVNAYNIGLGRLLRYLTLISSLRIQDITLRRQDRIRRKEEREDAIHKKQARNDRKELELKEAVEEHDDEEEEFNRDDWLDRWDEENSDVEIPDPVEDELDLDLEEGYFDEELVEE